jgi:monoamine oxidase
MWVVGEMVSKNQGWVEGALESVEKVIGEVLKSL